MSKLHVEGDLECLIVLFQKGSVFETFFFKSTFKAKTDLYIFFYTPLLSAA